LPSGNIALTRLAQEDGLPAAQKDPRSLRAQQLAFAYHFENILTAMSARIHRLADPESADPPGGRCITGNAHLDRALGILLRIRQEAALFLGDLQPQRGRRSQWRDEYYFCLAVYGLTSAKYDYKESEAAFAILSAGMAAAQMEQARDEIAALIRCRKPALLGRASRVRHPYPSYRVPLAHVHRMWKRGQSEAKLREAIGFLQFAQKHFAHAVPIQQEYMLLLCEAGRDEGGLKILGPFEDLCRVFSDEETLCRIGRLCKDLGDRALAENPVPINALLGHAAWQWYDAALRRYREAFEISRRYYPGVNAATLALLVGQHQDSHFLASQVLELCRQQDLSKLHIEDCFWVLVTQGEANLLMHKGREAAAAYREALGLLAPHHRGMAQSAYNQVCRLAWALGNVVRPAVEVFRTSPFKLEPGPLGNCADIERD